MLRAHNLKAQVKYIARYEGNNTDKDIAIFVPTNNQQLVIAEILEEYGTQNPVQMYISRDRDLKKLDFHQRGIKILTYASAKGLEFDAVFLPELERRTSDPNSDLEKMRFYVLTSRAREELFLLFSGNQLPPFLEKLPPDLFNLEEV